MEKTNYFLESLKEIKEIKEKDKKPRLLLHICCGACSCYPLLFLIKLFDVTILFSNSNIYPIEEYKKRLFALTKYKEEISKIFNVNIPIIVDDYDYDNFKLDLLPYKDEKEGCNRCKICISKRLNRLFECAKKFDFSYCTTVMSISRNKDAQFINETGLNLEKKYPGIKYLVADFKKNNGQDIGVLLSKKFDVYRQDYCGCEFSLNKEK